MKLHYLIPIALVASLLCGCSDEKRTASKKPERKQGSTAQTMVDGLTGRAAVRSGNQARRTIEDISAKQRNDLNEIVD